MTPLEFDESAIRQMSTSMDRASRRGLIVSLRRLADSLEDTVGTIHRYGHIDLEKAMIKVGLDLGLFNALASASGPKSTDDLALETGASPQLMSTAPDCQLSAITDPARAFATLL
jgi:hypothetical protein